MNQTVGSSLLAGNKFMDEMHIRQPVALDRSGFAFSVYGLFARNKKRIQWFKETGDSRYIYQHEYINMIFSIWLGL